MNIFDKNRYFYKKKLIHVICMNIEIADVRNK